MPTPEDPEDPLVDRSAVPVERPPGASGSIDVEMSGAMPAASSGAVAVPIEPEPTSKRKRAATAVGEGVSMVGEGVSKLGEGVSKLGGATSKVPLVGSSISKLGDGMQAVGGSLHDLGATKTRGGRLLVRSMIVGFLLVASWIVVIVMLQLRSTETVDFRPAAVEILTQLSNRNFEQVYDNASPRFQEMARKERFVDDMTDLRLTVGAFREIAAINDTLVTTGPTGRIGRVSMTLVYAQATCKASVSFHYDEDVEKWRLLGLGVELPSELQISQRQREERIAACQDPMNPRSCDVHAAAVAVFEQLR
ncbi:MAG: hypothetical protein NT062_13420, partial [Proteobacteria bacterium]|nr:hypothetical protein [Pseudomonadota bacterium]